PLSRPSPGAAGGACLRARPSRQRRACRPWRAARGRAWPPWEALRLRPWLPLLRYLLARALGDAHLAPVVEPLEADACRLAVSGIGKGEIGQMDRRLLRDDAAFLRRRLALMAPN